jgi:hypothetical protein
MGAHGGLGRDVGVVVEAERELLEDDANLVSVVPLDLRKGRTDP